MNGSPLYEHILRNIKTKTTVFGLQKSLNQINPSFLCDIK